MKLIKFLDKLEDRIRKALSKRPIAYTFIGGVGIVLFWRGVWLVADDFEFMTGYVSILISTVILLLTGLFVSFFIGDELVRIVLFWRGVWLVADDFEFMTGYVSILISTVILLLTGLFVSFFIGDELIIAGLKEEKKISEKTEEEINNEEMTLQELKKEIRLLSQKLGAIEKILRKQNGE